MSWDPYNVGTPPRRGTPLLTKGDLEEMLRNATTSGAGKFEVPREQFQQILRSAISALAAPATPATVAQTPKGVMRKSDFELLLADVKRLAHGERISFSTNEAKDILETALKAFRVETPKAPSEPFHVDAYRKGFREAMELFRDELGDGDLDAERLRARVAALDVVAQELAEKAAKPTVAKPGDVFVISPPEATTRTGELAQRIAAARAIEIEQRAGAARGVEIRIDGEILTGLTDNDVAQVLRSFNERKG